MPHWQYSPSIFKCEVMLYFLSHPELIFFSVHGFREKWNELNWIFPHSSENKNELKFIGIASFIVCPSFPDKWIRDSSAMKQLKLMIDGLKMTVTWVPSTLGCLETRCLLFICSLRKTPVESHSVFHRLNYICLHSSSAGWAELCLRIHFPQESLKTI